MNIEFDVEARATVHISQIAESFSEMDSRQQAIVLHELFDALEFKCKHYENQLSHIAREINLHAHKGLINTLEKLVEFLKDQKNES